jgi:hypothetical protein
LGRLLGRSGFRLFKASINSLTVGRRGCAALACD